MTTEELGTLGELKLGELCTQGSLFSNPAKRDVHGFDNLVQVGMEQQAPAHDLVAAPIRAFVQAKATQKRSGSIGIRLTNWQHMIADPEPWFVFVCEVSADRDVAAVFLVHVNEHWMEKALRRLRKYSGKGKSLGSKEMTITYGQGDRLPRIHGEELRARVIEAIGSNAEAYRDKKKTFYATCGYSAESHRVALRFPEKPRSQHYREWADVALGLRSDLDVEHVKITDQRFGDAIVKVDGPASILTLQVRPIQTAQLQLFNAKLGNHSIRADIFSTTVVPHIPDEMSSARFKMGPFSLVIDTGKCDDHGDGTCSVKTRVSWDYDERFSLAQMGEAARAMMLMSSPGTRVSLQLSAAEDASMEFWLGVPPSLKQGFARYLLTVQAAATVGKYVGLEGIELASGELDHLPWPTVLASSIVEHGPDVELRLPAVPKDKSKKAVLVVSCAFPIADWVIFSSGALPLKGKSKDKFVFTTEHAQNLGVWKVRSADANNFPIVKKQAEFVERLEQDRTLEVFSVDPRTDDGMKALMSGGA